MVLLQHDVTVALWPKITNATVYSRLHGAYVGKQNAKTAVINLMLTLTATVILALTHRYQ